MAVNWLWKNKMGEYTRKLQRGDQTVEQKISLYAGNCLGVEIYEFPDSDEYQFAGFWNDDKHLKRCLGIGKDSVGRNLYEDVTVIRLNKYFAADVKKIAKCFCDANTADTKWNLNVEFYYEEPKEDK